MSERSSMKRALLEETKLEVHCNNERTDGQSREISFEAKEHGRSHMSRCWETTANPVNTLLLCLIMERACAISSLIMFNRK